jgi:fructoselysine 6-kinase
VHVGQSSGLDAHVPAIAAQAKLSYDFSVRRDGPHRRAIGPHCFLASVSGSDLGEGEAHAVAQELQDAGARWVLVTRGREGALLFGDGTHFAVTPEPVAPVDTLGAGDAFIARTLYGLLAGETPEALLSGAASLAARACLYYGAVGHAAPLALPASYKGP